MLGLERDSPTWPGSSVRGKEECTPVRQQGIRGCLHANGSFEGHTPQSCKGTGSAQKGLFNRRTHLREAGVSRRSSLFRPTSIFASTAPLRLATGINPPPSLGGKFCTSQGACPEGGPRFRRQRTKKKTYVYDFICMRSLPKAPRARSLPRPPLGQGPPELQNCPPRARGCQSRWPAGGLTVPGQMGK